MKRELIEDTIIAAALIVFVCFNSYGCYPMFAAKTTVHVQVLPDGTCTADFTSDKEENDLVASVCGGNVSVKKAGSQPEVIAAVLNLYQNLANQIATLTAAAKAGAAGS